MRRHDQAGAGQAGGQYREAELRDKLAEVTRSRTRLVNAFEAERRRIERDLHDGAQQRLVATSVSLGLARLDLPPGPAADHVAHAHEQAKLALVDLRELIQGIRPRILADRGLPAAIDDVASRCPVPVGLRVVLDERVPESIEATAYFVVCEALANVAEHSRAASAWVHAYRLGNTPVTCSKTGSATSQSSSKPCTASLPAAPSSTPKYSGGL